MVESMRIREISRNSFLDAKLTRSRITELEMLQTLQQITGLFDNSAIRQISHFLIQGKPCSHTVAENHYTPRSWGKGRFILCG